MLISTILGSTTDVFMYLLSSLSQFFISHFLFLIFQFHFHLLHVFIFSLKTYSMKFCLIV